MIQLLSYQFEQESFTSVCFTLLRNAEQSFILILSHRNCHARSYTKISISPSFTERRTAASSGYHRGTQTDMGKSPPHMKNINNLRETKHAFLYKKERKLYEPPENTSLWIISVV